MSEKTFRILLIDDDPQDIEHVSELLSSSSLPYSLTRCISLEKSSLLLDNPPEPFDLVLLDLEFTQEGTTSLYFLQDIPIPCPIIIISHLKHFQRMTFPNMNVFTFISKSQLDFSLIASIKQCLLGPQLSKPQEAIFFPPLHLNSPTERVYVRDILLIHKSLRRTYEVILKNGSSISISSSIDMTSLYTSIKTARIRELIRISRSDIINLAYLSSVTKLRNGRIELQLLNYPNTINVGAKYLAELSLFLDFTHT